MANTDAAFRLLEIVGLLLPLAIIFGQFAIRVTSSAEHSISDQEAELLSAGVIYSIMGLVACGTLINAFLILNLQDLFLRFVLIILYTVFFGIGTAGYAIGANLASNLGVYDNLRSQRLSEFESEDTTTNAEEAEAEVEESDNGNP